MKLCACICIVLFTTLAIAKDDVKTVYKYKKYEKFDFEEMVIDGEVGTPGDLSVLHRFQRKYRNKLPYRKNFNAEIKKAVKRIR